jgi:LPXTG-site transpeptidase (sortase) family protein
MTDTIPNDPGWRNQYGLLAIHAPQGWDLSTGSAAVTIAVEDTGVDLGHVDLAGKIVPGFDFVNSDNDPQDDNGHGTHVAGIAAAVSNNGIGVAGVSWGAHIMPVKVLNASGNGSYADVAAGIVWAADNGAQVINLSLGGSMPSFVLEDAVNFAYGRDVTLVAAAGNSGSNSVLYPARYPHVIAVAATDSSNNRASFSNFGPEIDVAAPGVAIYSTTLDNNYAYLSGTSMAAPFVSGLAAILRGIPGNVSPDEITREIETTALDLGIPGRDDLYGYGLIQMDAALQPLLPTSTPSFTPTSTSTGLPQPPFTPSSTPTATLTPTPTETATPTVTVTSTSTPASTSTGLPRPTFTPSSFPTATLTPTRTETATSTVTLTSTSTPSATWTNTRTPTQTGTSTPTFTPTATITANSPLPAPATAAVLPATGFTSNRITILPAQPAVKAYTDFSTGAKPGLGDLWLEIPRLEVELPIVGVPQSANGWDVAWLGDKAGWLNGTAFPTQAGNSVLAAHVYDASGKPGPFVHLDWLLWGDPVIVHAFGQEYVYVVRESELVAPGAVAAVIRHEELPWLTLITCQGYNEASNTYRYRVVVRAVQVAIK